MTIDRRTFLSSAPLTAMAAAMPLPVFAQGGTDSAESLPTRVEFVIRGAYIITMDPDLGDVANGDIHVRDGTIVAVGSSVAAGNAEIIDGSAMIVAPGLVDTHWHMWNTLFRSYSGNQAAQGYFPTVAHLGMKMAPEDMYASTFLSAAEAINSGITTVTNWCHNARSIDHADADARAMTQAGLRGRFYYGWGQGLDDSKMINLSDLETFAHKWPRQGLISLGFGWRGKYRAGPLPEEVYRPEIEAARSLGLPISVHVGSSQKAVGQVSAHVKEKLLGPDTQIVHALSATPDEIAMVHDVGAAFASTPGSELRIGFGFSKIGEFMSAKVPTGIGVDSTSLSGDANLFGIIKMARDVENAKALSEFRMNAQQALALGTLEGARSIGLDGVIGSLKPGKRADLVMISTQALNMAVFTEPANMLVECTQPENVDTVVIDGRILKRGGALTHLKKDSVVAEARVALDRVRARAAL